MPIVVTQPACVGFLGTGSAACSKTAATTNWYRAGQMMERLAQFYRNVIHPMISMDIGWGLAGIDMSFAPIAEIRVKKRADSHDGCNIVPNLPLTREHRKRPMILCST
ncbi:MAG: hypothetical protein IPJ47_12600 [Anaerolineales bacterium]|nr:hypothetical protein [Anaerolineales bacterium]